MTQLELLPIWSIPPMPKTIPTMTKRWQRVPNSKAKRRRCKTVP